MSLNHQRSIFSNSFLTHYIVTQLISLVVQSCLTLCDPMDCSMPDLPVLHISLSLLKLMSIESMLTE